MKAIFTSIIFVLLGITIMHAEEILLGDTKDLYEQKDSTQRFTWTVAPSTLEALPKWTKGQEPPVSVAQAEKIAHEWTQRQPLAAELPERPYSVVLVRMSVSSNDHYYYKVHFATEDGSDSFWTVHILLDGTIIEPHESKPNKLVQPIR